MLELSRFEQVDDYMVYGGKNQYVIEKTPAGYSMNVWTLDENGNTSDDAKTYNYSRLSDIIKRIEVLEK